MREQFRRFKSGNFLTAKEMNDLSRSVRSFSTGAPIPYSKGVRFSTDLQTPHPPFVENIVEVIREVSEYLYKVRTRYFAHEQEEWNTDEAGGPYYMDSSEFETEYDQGDKVVAYWDKQRHAYVPCTAIGEAKESEGDLMRCGYTCRWIPECCLYIGNIKDFVDVNQSDDGYCNPDLESELVWIIADVWSESGGELYVDLDKVETILDSTGWVRRISKSHECVIKYSWQYDLWDAAVSYTKYDYVVWHLEDDDTEYRLWKAKEDTAAGEEPDVSNKWEDVSEEEILELTLDLPVYEWCSEHGWAICPKEHQTTYVQFSQFPLWDKSQTIDDTTYHDNDEMCEDPDRVCDALSAIGKVELSFVPMEKDSEVATSGIFGLEGCAVNNYLGDLPLAQGVWVGEFTVSTTQPKRYFPISWLDTSVVPVDNKVGWVTLDPVTGLIDGCYWDPGGGDEFVPISCNEIGDTAPGAVDPGWSFRGTNCYYPLEKPREDVEYRYKVVAVCNESAATGEIWHLCIIHVYPEGHPCAGDPIASVSTGSYSHTPCENLFLTRHPSFSFGNGSGVTCETPVGFWGTDNGPKNQFGAHTFAGCYNQMWAENDSTSQCDFCFTKWGITPSFLSILTW